MVYITNTTLINKIDYFIKLNHLINFLNINLTELFHIKNGKTIEIKTCFEIMSLITSRPYKHQRNIIKLLNIKMLNRNFLKIIFVFSLLLSSCSEEPTSLFLVQSELPHIEFKGFNIPQFPTAQGQLNYAKSGFVDSQKKKAALQIISFLFPASEIQCGNAALTLSYMNLGNDYRFANQHDFNNAVISYHEVIQNYSRHPQILIKANWYLGWIHCELLNQKDTGLAYYWYVVKTWPEIQMGISSPVPWVSLVYPSSRKGEQLENSKTQIYWASISLLEIIRHTDDKDEALKAFNILWKKYQKTVVTGLALKLMLKKADLAADVKFFVKPYLKLNIANKYLSEQIYDQANL